MFRLLKVLGLLSFGLLFIPSVYAQETGRWYVYDNVEVDLTIDKSSVVTVTEKLTYEFHGKYRGVFRDITLTSDADRIRCQNDPGLQCGGFVRLEVIEVSDNEGKVLPETGYTVEEVYDDSYKEKRLRVTWLFAPDGRQFAGDLFEFTIKYKVYKSIGYFDTYDLLYWNALFPDRDVVIKNADVSIRFPDKLDFSIEDLNVLSGVNGINYDYEYLDSENKLTLSTKTVPPGQDFTVLFKLPKGMILQPPKIKVSEGNHETDLKFYNDTQQLDYVDSVIELEQPGNYSIKATAFGYQSEVFQFELANGETKEISVQLNPELWAQILYFGLVIVNCASLLAIPGGILMVYLHWRKKGRDKGRDFTIIPQFQPPDDVRAYMLGSVKDERPDMVDISSMIIDLAYRGHIKIVEQKGKGLFAKNYFEFIKLKSVDPLSEAEMKFMNALFKSGESTDTNKLKNVFYTSLPSLKNAIYDEMVSKKIFEVKPDKIRIKYAVIAILLIALSIFVIVVVGGFMIALHYLLAFGIIIGIALLVAGMSTLIVSYFMPAKTEYGKELLSKIWGFRMFIYHADRYRLQNLTPEMFEKFLSYAVVFGLEKKWGEAFKDIYKGNPDWYESSGSSFNSVLLANSLSNMMNTTSIVLATSPSSSGSHSGGGWSGGGGFSGGFSGGGGGGGGGGAF